MQIVIMLKKLVQLVSSLVLVLEVVLVVLTEVTIAKDLISTKIFGW